MKVRSGITVATVAASIMLGVAGCGKGNALSRDIEQRILATKDLPVVAVSDDGTASEKVPLTMNDAYFEVQNGVRIRLNEKSTLDGTEYASGTEFVKRNGKWSVATPK